MKSDFHSTTICAIEKDGKFAMAGDGQVTMGEQIVMKGTAKKVRRIYVCGFKNSVKLVYVGRYRFYHKY